MTRCTCLGHFERPMTWVVDVPDYTCPAHKEN